MGFIDRIQSDASKRYPRAIRPKDGPQPPGHFSFGTQLQGGPRHTDPYGASPAPSLTKLVENYNAVIYAMVERNRNAVSRIPLRLLADGSRAQGAPRRACDPIKVSRSVGRRLAENGHVSTASVDNIYEIRNHPLLDCLDNPDPYHTFSRKKLIGALTMCMDVVGSGFLVPEGRGWDYTDDTARIKGPPENLWFVYPQYVIPIRLGSSPIVDVFQYFSDRIPMQAMIWFRRNTSLRDMYGAEFSPTYAGEAYRKQEQEQIAILSQVLSLGPRPNMIASAKDAIVGVGKTEKDAFEKDLVRKHAAGYAGGVLVTNGAWDITPVSYSPADLAGKEISLYDIYNLAAIFGQPATYYTVDSNLANLQAADAQHARMGVAPRCDAIAETLTQLARRFDPRLIFSFDPALPEDEEARQKVIDMKLANGQTTINKVNEETNEPPHPWGDEPLIDKNKLPLSLIIQAHQMSMTSQATNIENQKTKTEYEYSEDPEEEEEEEGGGSRNIHSITEQEILRRLDSITRDIEIEYDEFIRKGGGHGGNPNHKGTGPGGPIRGIKS